MRALARGSVLVTKLSPEPLQYFSLFTDSAGHYRLDSLAAGNYELTFSSARLDSLEVVLSARRIALAEGALARLDFATPSGATLRAASCPGLVLPSGQGAVVGRVTSVETEKPVSDAVIAVSWPDLRIDPVTRRPLPETRSGGVPVDSLGQYRLCGVPTAVHLLIQVQQGARVGSVIELAVPDDAGVSVLNLSYSPKDFRIVEDTVVAVQDTVKLPPLTGAATITGIVRGPGGQPVEDAQVQVVDAAQPVRSDRDGRFTIAGLPGGTQLLEARKVGYRIGRHPVELRAGRTLARDIQLERFITLDSVRIVAQRSMYKEFEERKRMNGFGTYVRADQIERRAPRELSDLMRAYGFVVQGQGIDAKLFSGRGRKSILLGPCAVNVVIDRVQNQDINLLRPEDVGAMEVYRGLGGAPQQYEAGCGLVIIWTKR